MLQLETVSKHFGNLHAVDDLSLTVPEGKLIGLIGPNGSGKSTLLSTIVGELPLDGGRILFDGADISGATTDQIFRLGLARSYQDPSLFTRMTALDNGLLPVKEQAGERLRRAPWHRLWSGQEAQNARATAEMLDRLQIHHQAQTVAGDLSGGQMKLLELGRTLMGQPRLLLLDEPTAGVAPNLAYTIFEQIAQMRAEHDLTFLIVEHRLDILFDFVDSVYVMHLGKVLTHGTPDEVANNADVREVYFGE